MVSALRFFCRELAGVPVRLALVDDRRGVCERALVGLGVGIFDGENLKGESFDGELSLTLFALRFSAAVSAGGTFSVSASLPAASRCLFLLPMP